MNKVNKFFTIIFFILFSLGQLQRIQLDSHTAFYLFDVLIVVWIFIFLLKKIIENLSKNSLLQVIKKLPKKIIKKVLAFRQKFKLEYCFIIWSIASLLLNYLINSVNPTAYLYLIRVLVYLSFILLIAKENKKSFKQGFLASGFLILFLGFIQYFFLPDTRFLNQWGWDVHYYRLISTIFDPAFTGLIFVMTFLQWQSSRKINKVIKIVINVLLIIGLALTYSRASYLSYAAATGLLILKNKNWLKSIYFYYLLLLIIIIPFLPRPGGEGVRLERTSTIESRVNYSKFSVSSLLPYQYLTGRGLFNLASDYQTLNSEKPNHGLVPDNLLVFIFVSTGAVGLILSLIILIKWGKFCYQKEYQTFILLIVLLTASQFNNILQSFIFLMGGFLLTNKNKQTS